MKKKDSIKSIVFLIYCTVLKDIMIIKKIFLFILIIIFQNKLNRKNSLTFFTPFRIVLVVLNLLLYFESKNKTNKKMFVILFCYSYRIKID